MPIQLSFQKVQAEVAMLRSLTKAIHEAGGCPDRFIDPDMTVGELVEALAPNGIRFTYIRPEDRDD